MTISFQRMRVPRHKVRHSRRCIEVIQPGLQLTCRGRPEFFLGDGPFLAYLAQLFILEVNLQETP